MTPAECRRRRADGGTGRTEGRMAQVSVGRKLTRDYAAMSATPWTLWDVMLARRSCRKYEEWTPDARVSGEVAGLAREACALRGAPEGSVLAVTDPGIGRELRRRSYKGLANKINLWLARAPVNAFLVLALPTDDVTAERPSCLPRAVMAAQDCVLWLTSRGFGTCWLAGVNSREVIGVLGLPPDVSVPAVVCVGKPHPSAGPFTLDSVLRRALSRNRKPLSAVACLERVGRPFEPQPPPGRFRAAPEQDVLELLRFLAGGLGPDGAPPAPFAVEACLEAARIAPSGGNGQSWRFVAAFDADRVAALAVACGARGPWEAAVVASALESRLDNLAPDKPFWMMDVPIAVSHMSLMAASMRRPAEVFTEMDEGAVNELVGARAGERATAVMALTGGLPRTRA